MSATPPRIPVGTEVAVLSVQSIEELVTPAGQPFSLVGEVGVIQEELELNSTTSLYKGTIRFDAVTTGSTKGATSWWSEGWQIRVISWNQEEPKPRPQVKDPEPVEKPALENMEGPAGPPHPLAGIDPARLKQRVVTVTDPSLFKRRKVANDPESREVINFDAILEVARALCNHSANRAKLECYQQAQAAADSSEAEEAMGGPVFQMLLEAAYNTAAPSNILGFLQMAGWLKHWPGIMELYEKSRGHENAGLMAEQALNRAADVARRAKAADPNKRSALILASFLSYVLVPHDADKMSDEERRTVGMGLVEEFFSKTKLDSRMASYIRSLLTASPLGHKEMSLFLAGGDEVHSSFRKRLGEDLPLVFYLVASMGIHSPTVVETFKTALSDPQIDILIAAVTKEDLNTFLEKTGTKRKGSIKSILEACQLEAMKSSEENPYLILSKVLKVKMPDSLPSESRKFGVVFKSGMTPPRMADGSIVRVISCVNYNAEGIGLDPAGLIATVRVVSSPFHQEEVSGVEGLAYHGMLEFTELPPGMRTRKARDPFQGTGFSAIWQVEPISVTPDSGEYPGFSCSNEQK